MRSWIEHRNQFIRHAEIPKFGDPIGVGHIIGNGRAWRPNAVVHREIHFLTGLHVHKTTGQDLNSGGVSVDQFAAERVGDLTPLPSLELATDPVINGLDGAVNYTRMYGSYISWRKPNLPMPRLIDPRAAFERMFGARDASGKLLPQPSL